VFNILGAILDKHSEHPQSN